MQQQTCDQASILIVRGPVATPKDSQYRTLRNTSVLHRSPMSLSFSKKNMALCHYNNSNPIINLIVSGQCVLVFHVTRDSTFTFYTQDRSDGLEVSITTRGYVTRRLKTGTTYESQERNGGIVSHSGAYYWFSLDSQNQVLRAGVGEPRVETLTYMYAFSPRTVNMVENKKFMESLSLIELADTVSPIRLLKNPITTQLPLLVKDMDAITMDSVARNMYLPRSALSTAAQHLYGCIAGSRFVLNTPDFPDFVDAIEHSIRTDGLWCNKRLKEKATEFGSEPQPLETYLRITLGQNNGESPGVPYVMEIWPVGHYSPIHSHSEANAIIRVLHGSIKVDLYPYLCDDTITSGSGIGPFASKDFYEGDITWISPTLNQTHQLKNRETNKDTCITIQCYMYDESDTQHYDYFDYLGDNNVKMQYEPDSDMDFVEFKDRMRLEWENREKKHTQCVPWVKW